MQTIYSARGFREIGRFQFEGSFALTRKINKTLTISALFPDSITLFLFVAVLTYSLFFLASRSCVTELDLSTAGWQKRKNS